MSKLVLIAFVLAALCFCSALAVAFATHLSRQIYFEISVQQREIDALDVQWSQLKIEESTFSEHSLIERKARESLNMVFPGLQGSVMIVR
ncbi:MAG: cell division protein FtsL [Granulosicoccus sp.]|nr:cell division protein FtsL [Granulosicoccus sp.]